MPNAANPLIYGLTVVSGVFHTAVCCATAAPNNPPTNPHHPKPSPDKTAKPTGAKHSTEPSNRRTQPSWVQTCSTGSTPAACSLRLSFLTLRTVLRVLPHWNLGFTVAADDDIGPSLYMPMVRSLVIARCTSSRRLLRLLFVVHNGDYTRANIKPQGQIGLEWSVALAPQPTPTTPIHLRKKQRPGSRVWSTQATRGTRKVEGGQ